MSTTRRRGHELEAAIHGAVLVELAERGYPGVTYDRVAARAATSKPVLYRRWPTRAAMVMAAVMSSTTEAIAGPDTGDLARDLSSLLVAMRDNFGSTGRSAMLGLLAELDDTAADSLSALIFRWGSDLVEPLVTRAQQRGELGPSPIPPTVLGLPLDLARHDLAIRGALDTARIRDIVETVSLPLLEFHSHR